MKFKTTVCTVLESLRIIVIGFLPYINFLCFKPNSKWRFI